jgi:starch phosphorylase
MKVVGNGGLNLSILDGWWCEGYDGDNGWAIGAGEEYTDLAAQDDVESRALYELIEREIVPMFYARGADGLPRAWIKRMKRSIATLVPKFNTNRMVAEYSRLCYVPSHRRREGLTADKMKGAKELAEWRKRLSAAWADIRIETVDAPLADPHHVGAAIPVSVRVNLGAVRPDEVDVQLCYGLLDAKGEVAEPRALSLKPSGNGPVATFSGSVPCTASGQFGFGVRVLPKHANLANPFEPGLVTWG